MCARSRRQLDGCQYFLHVKINRSSTYWYRIVKSNGFHGDTSEIESLIRSCQHPTRHDTYSTNSLCLYKKKKWTNSLNIWASQSTLRRLLYHIYVHNIYDFGFRGFLCQPPTYNASCSFWTNSSSIRYPWGAREIDAIQILDIQHCLQFCESSPSCYTLWIFFCTYGQFCCWSV